MGARMRLPDKSAFNGSRLYDPISWLSLPLYGTRLPWFPIAA